MTAITDLTPMILPFVRDCSVPAAVVAARFACIEFYKLTLWQQEQLEPVDLWEGQSIYELEVPPNTVPAKVMRVELGDAQGGSTLLTFKTKDELDQLFGARWTTATGKPQYVTQFEPTDICLVPGPDADLEDGLRILCAVQPSNDCAEIDDSVFDYYAEALAYGARARLVETAGQPYYDPQSAPMLWGRFYGGISEAKGRRMLEHTRGYQTVKIPKW
jgi:hypothetical protein